MTGERLPFIDWLKCLGMLVIVYGHSAGQSIPHATDPFNPKQLGVVWFVFVMGYSLARESRPIGRVLYNRLFEVYFFGLAIALLISAIQWWRIGDLNESNFLPFVLGANVLFDNFPANPTTWYIGTYLHLLLMWAIVWRRVRVSAWLVALAIVIELLVRASLLRYCGGYVAYQLLTNWDAILLLGMFAARQAEAGQRPEPRSGIVALLLLAVVASWPMLSSRWDFDQATFPWMVRRDAGTLVNLLTTSFSISLLYFSYAWLGYEITHRLPDSAVIRLFARNTVIVFIAHMPLIYALSPYQYQWMPPGPLRAAANLLIYYVALSLVSEVIRRLVQPQRVRDALFASLARWRGAGRDSSSAA